MEETVWKSEVGNRIREERIRLGLTQEELAEKLEVTVEHVRNVEKGRRGVSVKSLKRLNELSGLSIDYFLTGKVEGEGSQRLHAIISGMDPSLYPYAEQLLTTLIEVSKKKEK